MYASAAQAVPLATGEYALVPPVPDGLHAMHALFGSLPPVATHVVPPMWQYPVATGWVQLPDPLQISFVHEYASAVQAVPLAVEDHAVVLFMASQYWHGLDVLPLL